VKIKKIKELAYIKIGDIQSTLEVLNWSIRESMVKNKKKHLLLNSRNIKRGIKIGTRRRK